uniref:winged helix-turn-helix domain-containing protein n=1 Tax=uncultured Phenylobacterium sp. TaxID=349273 RepID=UPI0025E5A95A
MQLAHQAAFSLGALDVRPPTREVVFPHGREVLQPRVMQVLVALAWARGAVVSRDDLIASCWGGRVVGEDAITLVMMKLRRLAERSEGAFAVETVPRVGYRLVTGSGLAA